MTNSDTTGEKPYEEFYSKNERLDLNRYNSIGIIKNDSFDDLEKLENFKKSINQFKKAKSWNKKQIVKEFMKLIPDFKYIDYEKYLDKKM